MDNISHGGFVQLAALCCHDLYEDFENFYDLGVQSGYEESFIELDDLTYPLDNEFQWSHLVQSDGLVNEVDQHDSEMPPPLSVDDYTCMLCYDAPAISQLLPETPVGFSSYSDTPQKVSSSQLF